MKNKIFKTIFLALCTATAVSAFATQDFTKTIEETFDITNGGKVEIINKYGNIDIRTNNSNKVTFRVEIIVDAKNADQADEVFENIDIDFYNNSDYIKAETTISENNNFWSRLKNWNNSNYEINYYVNVPMHVYLKLNNKYGNIQAMDMNNKMDIELKYGNFTLGNVKDLNANLGYGDGSVQEAGDIDVNVQYGKLDINKCGDIDLVSKYSKIKIGEADEIESISKYDDFKIVRVVKFENTGKYDRIDIEDVGHASVQSKYTDIKFNSVAKSAKIQSDYGSIRIEEISTELQEIDIASTYAGIKIGNPQNVGFRYDIQTKYGDIDIDYNSTADSGTDDNEKWAKGKHNGNGSGFIRIVSKYGSVRVK